MAMASLTKAIQVGDTFLFGKNIMEIDKCKTQSIAEWQVSLRQYRLKKTNAKLVLLGFDLPMDDLGHLIIMDICVVEWPI